MTLIRAFRNSPSGLLGMGVVGLLLSIAVIAPIAFGHLSDQIDFAVANLPPGGGHLFGTDRLGRDILIRLLAATRLSLGLALAATGLAILIGIPVGAAVTLLPGNARSFGLRVIDTMIAFPALIVAIYIGAIIGPGPLGAVLGVGIASSFGFARLSSSLAMSVAGREYVLAARVIGAGPARLLLRYVLPNIADVLIVGISAGTANAIIAIAGLSFIGLGIQAPAFDWGRMLTEGVNAFYVNPAAALGPALFVSAAALGFGFSGEGVARAMNPLLWAKPVKRKSGEAEEGHDREDREVATPLPLPLDGDRLHVGNGAAPKSDGNVVLDVRNLRVVFPGHPTPIEIVKGVDFSVSEGEVLGIVGESGSGKTMTSLAVAQLVPHPGSVTGSVRLNGEELSELPRAKLDKLLGTSVAVVFQDPMSSLNPALTIGVQLTEGVQKHLHEPPDKARTEAIARLNEVNIPTPRVQLDRHPHELSGGMRQRVMIAMGLMTNPRLLIADEPTTALDVTIQAQIMDLLEQVNEDHRTAVILISHNLGLVRQNCDRVLVMYAGRIVEELPSDRLTIDPLHPYTRALLAAVPDIAHDRSQPLEFIPGQTPDIGNPPRGCPYHPRCPLAMDICRERTPPLERHGIDRRVACWAAEQVKA